MTTSTPSALEAHADSHRSLWPHNTPRFAVIDLNGQPCERYMTRFHANHAVNRLAASVDYVAQDKTDSEFCAHYGVPFQPRRYFSVDLNEHRDIA